MLKQYRELEKFEEIVIGADTASGVKDFCCAQFLSKTYMDVPLVYHSPMTATSMTNDLVPILEKIFDDTNKRPIIAYERNNGGAFEMDRLGSMNRVGKYKLFQMPNFGKGMNNIGTSVKYGWDTNTHTRSIMLEKLKDAVDNRILTIYDRPTIEEMFAFVIVQTSTSWKAQAEKHAHDDRIMALAIAYQMYLLAPTAEKKALQYRSNRSHRRRFNPNTV